MRALRNRLTQPENTKMPDILTAPATKILRADRQHCRDVVGSDHAHRRQPRHLHQNRFRLEEGDRMLQHVVDLPRLQHLHAEQGSARCPFHHQPDLRHLRRQSRDLFGLCAEHGLRRQAAAAGGMDRQPRRSRRVHVRSQHFPGQSGRRRFLRDDGEGDQPERLGKSATTRRRRTPTITAIARSATS